MKLGIIGGSVFHAMDDLEILKRETVDTPYGKPSSPLICGVIKGVEINFLHRHGFDHTLPPHLINYRANLWALKHTGVTHVIAISAVGGITQKMTTGKIVIPHQLIDYTCSREHTFYDASSKQIVHVDFSYPYDEGLRQQLVRSIKQTALTFESQAVHAITQGPRLESAAEIRRLENDGCDIVGMTGMPEAGLARELDLKYACCAVVVNAAAGKDGAAIITMDEINENLATGMSSVREILTNFIPAMTQLS